MSRAAVHIPPTLHLEAPCKDRLPEYLAMIECAAARGEDGEGYYMINTATARADPAGHVKRLQEMEHGSNLPEGWVPMSTRWLIDDNQGTTGRVVGEARIRHALSPPLEIEGGHVGYFIHPELRGRGYGNAILALALGELARMGVERVLVTCNADNLRSRRVIERNGGAFDRYTTSPKSGKQVMRYWIQTAAQAPGNID